jgi:hypothetical protein
LRPTTVTYFSYHNIPLKLFLEISSTGEFERVVIKGKSDIDGCIDAWEEIIKTNSKETGDSSYNSYLSLYRAYYLLLNEYKLVKATLIYLMFNIDDNLIGMLGRKGYKIQTSGSKAYRESIESSSKKADNLKTKIVLREIEIQKFAGNKKDNKKQIGIEELIATLSLQLGFEVDDTITLCRYNQYAKILKERSKKYGSGNPARRHNR